MSLGAIKIDMADNIFGVLIVVIERGINILKLPLGNSHNSNPMVMKGITNFFGKGRIFSNISALKRVAAPVTVLADINTSSR